MCSPNRAGVDMLRVTTEKRETYVTQKLSSSPFQWVLVFLLLDLVLCCLFCKLFQPLEVPDDVYCSFGCI